MNIERRHVKEFPSTDVGLGMNNARKNMHFHEINTGTIEEMASALRGIAEEIYG